MKKNLTRETELQNLLDRLYSEYNFKSKICNDPIEFPHQYSLKEDIEMSAFISSCFAYGRIDLFKPIIKKILDLMGDSPYGFLLEFDAKKHSRLFSGIKYRFNDNKDIMCLLHILGSVCKNNRSIEALFKQFYRHDSDGIKSGITGFINYVLGINKTKVYARNILTRGLLQFFPSPQKGSACKRMNLFLRWMIRDRDIDFGIWKDIQKSSLIIPLDTHIAKVSGLLGLTARKTQDWKMAEEITAALKKFDPEDPLKYDFAMCHYGISCSANRTKHLG